MRRMDNRHAALLVGAFRDAPASAWDSRRPLAQRRSCPRRAFAVQGVPGGIPGWDCFDPPTSPLPPCDFRHQRAGFDCWPRSPPSAVVTSESTGHVDGMLPPCKDVPGGTLGWDCYDPPSTPLPPCDFHQKRIGIDCGPLTPPHH